ncbi:helix-turn-helix transcriptional regulator [Nitrosospira multiformis]|nr:helix-turn-helix domain-containing protein [Nitrosospira multiformis]
MDTENAASYVGLSVKTMATKRCDGTGPKFVKRGRVFYFKEDLDDWVNENGKLSSTAQAQKRRNLGIVAAQKGKKDFSNGNHDDWLNEDGKLRRTAQAQKRRNLEVETKQQAKGRFSNGKNDE